MKKTKKLVAIVLVLTMLSLSTFTAFAAPPNLVDDKPVYVSLGASQTAGYGLRGYLPENVAEDPLAASKASFNVYGYDQAPDGAYPYLVAENNGIFSR